MKGDHLPEILSMVSLCFLWVGCVCVWGGGEGGLFGWLVLLLFLVGWWVGWLLLFCCCCFGFVFVFFSLQINVSKYRTETNQIPRYSFMGAWFDLQTRTTAKVPCQKENKFQYIEKDFMKTKNFQRSVVLLFCCCCFLLLSLFLLVFVLFCLFGWLVGFIFFFFFYSFKVIISSTVCLLVCLFVSLF